MIVKIKILSLQFSDVFMGYKKEIPGSNGLSFQGLYKENTRQ